VGNTLRCIVAATLCALALCWSGSLAAAGGAGEFLYVENTDSGDISVIRIPDHEVVSTISLGAYLDDVVASGDGRILYANRVESSGHPLSKRVGDSGEVFAISTETEKVLWRAPVGGWPHHLTLSPDGRKLFVPLFDRMHLEVIDTHQQKVTGRIPAPMGSHGTRLSPDGQRLYVGSMLMDMIVVYDVDSHEILKRLPFADAVRPFVILSNEKTLFVQLSRLHGFQVVDLEKDKVVRQVDLPKLPAGTALPEFFPHTYNHGLEVTSDEKLLFAAGSAANAVAVYRLPGLELAAQIPVGKEPNWIVFDKQGRHAYVSNRMSDTVSVISVADLKEIKTIPVGKYPQRITTVVVPKRTK
jgi:YVTN family beta-propeller protein